MIPEHAWQATLDQLQMEMPRATFDTWVRDARFISYEAQEMGAEGCFTIGLENAYARDWVESRLKSTIVHILTGILNQRVSIEFITHPRGANHNEIEPENPETAWEEFLSQFQTKPFREPFNDYIKEARFLAFYDNRYIISLPSIEARNCVAETVNGFGSEILTRVLQKPIEIQFVVAPVEKTQSNSTGIGQSSDKTNVISANHIANHITQNEADVLIKPICTSIHEVITRPKSVVVVPAYILRWLPFLGPDKSWFLVAMRQRYFQTFGKKVAGNANDRAFTASRQQIARWSGLGKNLTHQYLQELDNSTQEGNFLAWFMQSFEHGKGKPKTYSFRADMPLTPVDVETLQAWLIENKIQETPIETVQSALEKQPHEILKYPAPSPSKHQLRLKPNPLSVQDIVLNTSGIAKSSPKYLPLKRLADSLQQHLQSPADNLFLTHYFLLEWLPKLGRTPAWIITILRDRGFIDHHTGIRRDRIKLEGGYSELAQLLNVSERQIRDWLPALEQMIRRSKVQTHSISQNQKTLSSWEKHQAKRHLVGYFLDKSAELDWSGNNDTTYEFKVKLEDPLTPEHGEIYELIEELLYDHILAGKQSGFENLIQELDDLVRDSDNLLETWYAKQTTVEETDPRFGQLNDSLIRDSDKSWYAKQTIDAEFDPRFARLKALLIKYLNPKVLLEIKSHIQQSLEDFNRDIPIEQEVSGGGGDNRLIWDWEKLLGYGGLSGQSRIEILQNPDIRINFLGQVIYGFENKVTAEGKGIKAPFKYAERHRHEQPLPEYIELASLPPDELAETIKDWQRYGPAFSISDTAFSVTKALNKNDFLRVIEDATKYKV